MCDLHEMAEARARLPDFNEAKTLDEYVAALMASELQLKRELDEMPELGDLPVEMKVRHA